MSAKATKPTVPTSKNRKLIIAGGIFAVWLVLFLLDETTFRPLEHLLTWFDEHGRANFRFFRHFGSLYATFVAMALIYTLAPRLRRQLVPLLLAIVITGGASSLLKNVISRDRPETNEGRSVFNGLFSGFTSKGGESMPSGHSTLAFANAAGLSALLPPARPVFLVLATMTGLSRIREGDHFPSDVFMGGLIGWFMTLRLMRLIQRLMKVGPEIP